MLKATLKLATFTVLSSVLLQSSLPVGAMPDRITQLENKNTESANPKTKNDLPGSWSAIYDVTDKVARANGQANTPWRLAVVSPSDVSDSSGSNTIYLQSSAVEKLASDRAALACLISQEMGHYVKQHKSLTAEEKETAIAQAQKEAEAQVMQESQAASEESNQTSGAASTIGGIIGGAIGSQVGREVADEVAGYDEEGRFQEIFEQKKQQLEASWQQQEVQQDLEADEVAYSFVAKAGFEPEGCVRAIEASKPSGADSNTETSQRVQRLRELMAQQPSQTLAQEGKTQMANSKPLNYTLASDQSSLQIYSLDGRSTTSASTPTGSTSQTVSQNASQAPATILFSNKPFSSGGNPSNKTEFDATETIYARIIFDRPIKEVMEIPEDEDGELKLYSKFLVRYTTSKGENWTSLEDNLMFIDLEKGQKDKNYIDLDIMPSPEQATTVYRDGSSFLKWLSRVDFEKMNEDSRYIKNGPQIVSIEISGIDGDAAYGEFSLPMTLEQQKTVVEPRSRQVEAKITENVTASRQLPDDFSKPSGSFNDPELSIANIKKLLSSEHPQILKVAIGADGIDYEVDRNDLGVIIAKYTARRIWIVYKESDGKCYFDTVSLKREYEGGGQYGGLTRVPNNFEPYGIACQNIK